MPYDVDHRHVVGKHADQSLCEDVVVLTPTRAAVVDGATAKDDTIWAWEGRPVSSGLFAAHVVAGSIGRLPAGMSVDAQVRAITERLGASLGHCGGGGRPAQPPAACAVVYDASLATVWRVGDSHLRIDGVAWHGRHELDRIAADFRAAVITSERAGHPATPDHALETLGRQAIWPLLVRQRHLANTDHPLGYGCFNGHPVPARFIETFAVPDGTVEVVLASDGYPDISGDFATAEATLARILDADPLCASGFHSTKGRPEGGHGYDDRAWLALRLT